MRLQQLEMKQNTLTISTSEKTNYLIYARKSEESEDKQVASIPDQLETLSHTIAAKDLSVKDKPFTEARSAKEPGRAEFNRLIQEIDSRNDVKGIIVWKLNRLFRNPEDEGKIRQRLSDGRIKEIVTPSKTYYEADSDFIMAVEGAQAQRFIRDLREDTARGVNSKLKKGIAPILAPPGYKNDITKRQGERDIIPDDVQFPLVRSLFEMYMTKNYSVQQLWSEAEKLKIHSNRGKIISLTQLHQMLRNPFYTGTRFIYGRKLHTNGTHKRMITDAEFDLIQDIMDGRSNHRKNFYSQDLLTGIMHCGECGMMFTSEVKTKHYKNGKSQTFVYYRCTKKKSGEKCRQSYLPAKELEEQVISFLDSITLSTAFVEWAIKWLKVMHSNQEELREAKYKATEQAYQQVVKKISRVVEMTISEMLTTEEGLAQKQELELEKNKLSEELSKMDTHVTEWSTLTIQTFDLVKNIKERFTNGSIEQRKTILRVIGSNLVVLDKKIDITIRNPFEYIQEAVKVINDNELLEPNDLPVISSQSAFLHPQNHVLGGRRVPPPRPPGPQPGALLLSYNHHKTINIYYINISLVFKVYRG